MTGIVEIAASRPKSASVNLSGAKVLADVNEPQRSLPFANKAVDLSPSNPEARVVRGNANFALGNYHAAAEDARTALAYDPQNQAAKALLQFSQSRLQDMASRVKVPPKPAFQETGETTADEITLAGKGFNESVEGSYRRKHPRSNFAAVDALGRTGVPERDVLRFVRDAPNGRTGHFYWSQLPSHHASLTGVP